MLQKADPSKSRYTDSKYYFEGEGAKGLQQGPKGPLGPPSPLQELEVRGAERPALLVVYIISKLYI